MSDVRNRLAPSAEKLLQRAYREALSMGQNAIESHHIALALAREARSDFEEISRACELIARRGRGAR